MFFMFKILLHAKSLLAIQSNLLGHENLYRLFRLRGNKIFISVFTRSVITDSEVTSKVLIFCLIFSLLFIKLEVKITLLARFLPRIREILRIILSSVCLSICTCDMLTISETAHPMEKKSSQNFSRFSPTSGHATLGNVPKPLGMTQEGWKFLNFVHVYFSRITAILLLVRAE